MTPSPPSSPESRPPAPPEPARTADLVITGCTVLTDDAEEHVTFREDAAIVVRDGAVDEVTSSAEAAGLAARERIDARGQVALPGLVNCHTHAPMVAPRGLAEDLPTEEWFNGVVWPVESHLTEQDVAAGARPACAEMIRGGVTCFADHYFVMDAVAAVVTACGIRAHLGQAYFSSQGSRGRESHWSSRCGTAAASAAGSPPPSPRTPPTPSPTTTSPPPPHSPASTDCPSTSTPPRTATRRRPASNATVSPPSGSWHAPASSTSTS
jgi:hypothetical protein